MTLLLQQNELRGLQNLLLQQQNELLREQNLLLREQNEFLGDGVNFTTEFQEFFHGVWGVSELGILGILFDAIDAPGPEGDILVIKQRK